jgi:hypothetical protein
MAWIQPIIAFVNAAIGIYNQVNDWINTIKASEFYQIFEYIQAQEEAARAREISQTYSRDCAVTQCNPHAPIPVIYGEHQVAGNIFFQRYNTDRKQQYLLVGLCRGPIEEVTDIKLNDIDFSEFANAGCSCNVYLGTADQRMIYNYLTDDQYGVKSLTGFQTIGQGVNIQRDTSTWYESEISQACMRITCFFGSGFQTANYQRCRPNSWNTASVYVKTPAPTGVMSYSGFMRIDFEEYGESNNHIGTTTSTWLRPNNKWQKFSVGRQFSPNGVKFLLKFYFYPEAPPYGQPVGTYYLDEFTVYEDTGDLRVLRGATDVGGLKNLAYLAFTLVKSDKLGDGIPMVTCNVKGKKVMAYGGVEDEWVSNLLTANQADVETDLTGFENMGATLTSFADTTHKLNKHGNRSLKVVANGDGQGFTTSYTTVNENQTYSAMVWLYQDHENTGDKVQLYLEEYTAAGVKIGETPYTADGITLSNHWVRYSVTRQFGATGKKAKLKVVTVGAPKYGAFYADQLMLYKGSGVDVWMRGGQSTGLSDNPAWCLLDLMRNNHYGVGYSDTQLDLESFRTSASYCAEQIPPPSPGDVYNIQSRFRLNLVLDWQESWINVFNKIRMNCNAYAIERQGRFTLKNNIPETTAQMFDYDDIVPDSLVINWKGLDQQYDVVRVHYTEPEKKWTRQYAECRKFEYDETIPVKPRVLDIEVFGTTTRAQASRIASFHYRRLQYCKLTGEFRTSMMAANLTPGDVIEITYPPFVWDHQKVMITAMQCMENHDIRITFEIYDERVFSDDEGTDEPENTIGEILKAEYVVPEDPENLIVVEAERTNVVGVYVTGIDGSFTMPHSSYYNHALIQISTDGTSYNDVGTAYGETFHVEPVTAGTPYYVRVKSVSDVGLKSNGVVAQITTQGNNSVFASVTGLMSRYEENVLTLVWNAVSDLRPFVYEIRKGSSWDTAITLGTTPLTRFVSQGNGTYWVSAVYNGVYSITPASIKVDGALLTQNILAVYDECTSGWSGTVSDGAVKVDGGIKLAGSGLFDDVPDLDGLTSFDFYGGIQAFGAYTIPESHRVDIGLAENCNIAGSITVTCEGSLDFEGDPNLKAGGKIYIRIAQDDGIFGDWSEFIPGPYLGRIFDFQVRLTSSDPDVTAFLSRFTYSVDMPDKYDQGKEVWVETTGTVVPFNYNFHTQPQMLITVLDAEGGETVVLKSNEITNSQFTVRVINGSGTPVRKQINWVAKGY